MHHLNIALFDFETTGLPGDPNFQPLEVAGIIVDKDLNELAVLESTLYTPEESNLDSMNDFVRDMHTKTGLLERLASQETFGAGEVEAKIVDFLDGWFPQKGVELMDGTRYKGILLGGNSVGGMEVPLFKAFHAELYKKFSYRSLDISSINEAMHRFNPAVYAALPAKKSDHTALTDIRAALNELRYYRDAGFVAA